MLVSRQNESRRIRRCPHQPRVLCIRFSGAPRIFILLTGAAETYPVRPYKKNKMKFKASGMHAAPISSQRTSLRVFVRLDAHHLLMVTKKDREKLGGIGGKTLRLRISQKVQVSGRVSRLVLFRGKVGLETGGQGRAGRLSGNFPLGVRLRWPRRATRPPASKLDSCSFVATPNRASKPAILSENSRLHARMLPRSRM